MAKRATIDDLKERLDRINPNLFEMLKAKKRRFSFRVNLHKIGVDELIDMLKRDGLEPEKTIFEDTFTLPIDKKGELTKVDAYSRNYIYIQNLSSIFSAYSLNVEPDDWVLDLAAAPGGKSLIFSQTARKVSAVEPNRSRF